MAKDRPHLEGQDGFDLRNASRARFRRNQALGVLLVLLAALIWRLLHTNPAWLFPPGWWRL